MAIGIIQGIDGSGITAPGCVNRSEANSRARSATIGTAMTETVSKTTHTAAARIAASVKTKGGVTDSAFLFSELDPFQASSGVSELIEPDAHTVHDREI